MNANNHQHNLKNFLTLMKYGGLFVLMIFSNGVPAMTNDESVQVWFDELHSGQQWRVRPVVRTNEFVSLRYVIETEKSGTSGKSHSNQSGVAKVEAGKDCQLATLQMNLQSGDQLHLNLKVFQGELLVAERILDYPEATVQGVMP